MEDYIDILTKNGKLTGEIALKSEIHAKGFYHNSAHVWLYTNDEKILLQQRAEVKVICPLLWDVSVAGHVDAGETVEQSAVRETKEEIGLTISISDLLKIGVFECFQTYKNGIIDNEFHNTFIVKLNVDTPALTPQKEEVEALKLVSFDEFETLLKHSENNMHFVSSNRAYYNFVLEHIKKQSKISNFPT